MAKLVESIGALICAAARLPHLQRPAQNSPRSLFSGAGVAEGPGVGASGLRVGGGKSSSECSEAPLRTPAAAQWKLFPMSTPPP
jgi:hypothetical protein